MEGGACDGEIDALFAYGTLMRGECRFATFAGALPRFVLLGALDGAVLHATDGDYPALRMLEDGERGEGAPSVEGELMRFDDLPALLPRLDAVEEFVGFEDPGSLYHRRVVQVRLGDGELRRAWTYVAARPGLLGARIGSGSWRAHRGGRSAFLDELVAAHLRHCPDLLPRMRADGRWSARTPADLVESLAAGELTEGALAQRSGLWNALVG